MSKVDYAKIRQDNIEEYGKGTRHLSYFADIYSTRTHFIFEILQNAEDALSRRLLSSPSGYVGFHLHQDRLEIYHNGKPFDDRDIVGICGIGEGTKTGDYTQIGKFGIGFKSVYAYSFFPQIHSEDEHFEIRRFVEPHEIEATSSKDTLITLPFDQPDKRPEWAFRKNVNADVAQSEISQAITKLNIRTLLFLRNIEKIEWILANGEQGFLTKENQLENKQYNWRIVEVSDHQGKREQWQIFARNIKIKNDDKDQIATIEVAFLLENGKVSKADDTELVISFPTEKKTELGFLIQAPFKATKSRDNIKSDDPANHQMIQTAARLAVDSLSVLRDTNCLSVASYNAFPLDEDDFPEDNLFRPVYDRVREALKTQPILPAHGGGFIKADEAKLARVKGLVDLFSSEQLGELFEKEKLAWLDASITSDSFPYFHSYLLGLSDGIQITPESLVSKLTADFLSKQPIAWLIQFIQYAEQGTKALRRVPFIRLESGEQVDLRQEDENPIAWFAPENSTGLDLIKDFPLVHHKLAENEEVRKFLEKEGIHEIKSVDIVEQCILPKYQDTPFDVDTPFSEYEKAYRADLYQIGKAYADADDEIKEGLNKSLNDIEWLACIHANGNEPDKVFWKTPESTNLYAKPTEKLGFTVPEDKTAYFLHPVVSEALAEFKSINDYLNESIQPIAPLTIVKDFILPNYKTPSEFDEVSYRKDLQWICKAFSGDESVKDELKQSLSSPITWHPPTTWLACVHASGKEPEEIIWRKPKAGDLFAKPVDEQTFRVPENMNGYFLHPSVVDEFSKNESARMYLEKCVNEMDAIVIVEKFILPKYTNPDTTVDFDEALYRADLQWIGKAYNSNKKYLIADKLKNTAWLACVHASGNHPDCVIWEKSDTTVLFKSTETHCEWFSGLEDVDVYFLHPIVKKELNGIADDLISSIGKGELVIKQTPNYQGYVVINNQHGCHKRGLDGFDSNWEITGITQMLTKPRPVQSKILWNLLLINNKCIRGFTESSNRSNWSNIKKKEEFSKIGNQLSTSKWLPDKAGIWHKPSELLLTDLPDEFDTDSLSAIKVADKLGMKTPEEEQAINIVAGDDSDLKRLIESYKSASDADRQKMLKIIPQEIPPQPAPSFKDGINSLNRPQRGSIASNDTDNSSHPLTNPERYQNKVEQAVEEGIKQHEYAPQTIRFLPVRESASNKTARDFLYAEYQGKCQITDNTFPKASANANGEAENYFEACSLLSYNNADYLNNAGNMLCVSADTMAKLKNASFEWLDDLEAIIENFNNRQQAEIENVKAKVILAGEECEIIWSERHFALLVALWEKA
jgi:hypothetical protein